MREVWDRIGISASVLCVIHCLLTPVLVVTLPFLGHAMAHGWFHTVIVAVVFPVAVWALWNGYLLHRLKRILWLGGVGIAFMVAALMVGHHDFRKELALMIVAGILLSSAHLINLRACRLNHH